MNIFMKKKIIGLAIVTLIILSPVDLYASKKMTTKKATAYSSDLELYGKTLNEIEGIITKKHADKEKLQSAIEKLESQEKKLITYRDGEFLFDYYYGVI